MPPYITYLMYGVDLSRHTGESGSIHYLTGNRRKTLVRGNPIGHPIISMHVNKLCFLKFNITLYEYIVV